MMSEGQAAAMYPRLRYDTREVTIILGRHISQLEAQEVNQFYRNKHGQQQSDSSTAGGLTSLGIADTMTKYENSVRLV